FTSTITVMAANTSNGPPRIRKSPNRALTAAIEVCHRAKEMVSPVIGWGSFIGQVPPAPLLPHTSPAARLLDLRRRYRLSLQLRNTIAELGGALEFQVGGRGQHLRVQFFQIFFGHVIGRLAGHVGDQLPRGDLLFDASADGGADGLRSDAMLG